MLRDALQGHGVFANANNARNVTLPKAMAFWIMMLKLHLFKNLRHNVITQMYATLIRTIKNHRVDYGEEK